MSEIRKQHLWAIIALSTFVLTGTISLLGSSVSPQIIASNFNNETNSINSPLSAATINLNLNQYAEGEILAQPIQFNANAMYNLTIKNTGDAELFAYVVQTISTYSGTSVVPTEVYSDQLIRSVGIPWWDTFNAWDTNSYTSRVSSGASVGSAAQKSIVIYLDDSFPTSSVQLTVLLKLVSTTNPYNNTVNLDWVEISTASPAFNIAYNATGTSPKNLILPNSYQIVEFSTANDADLTNSILNQTISVNSSLKLFQWQRDLSGNTILTSRTLSGITNTLMIPYFNNMRLDGHKFLGLVANLNSIPTVELSWNFSDVVATFNYSEISFSSPGMVEFQLNQVNRYWRVMEVPTTNFNITFLGSPITSQDYWDVRIDFYAIGKSNGQLFTLDNYGVNASESASIFTTRQSTQYAAYDFDYLKTNFAPQTYTWYLNGTANPIINLVEGTQYLGLELSATQNPSAVQNFNCSIEITEIPIQDLISGEKQQVGSANGSINGNYRPFQVRKFSFENFDQFEWGFRSENSSKLDSVTQLKCNDPDSTPEQYIPDLNNSLESVVINTDGLQGKIWLRYNISGSIASGDNLAVHIINSSGISPAIRSYGSGSLTSTIRYESLDVTNYNGTGLQITFNFTSNWMNNVAEGPTIDNVRVTNGTDEVFFDDFEGDLSHWTQYDLSPTGTGMYWRLDRWTQNVNTPKIYIIYPNIANQLIVYPADPATYTSYTYKTLDYNPYAQPGDIAYIITTASGALVQNFTVAITQTTFSAQTFQNGALLTATHTVPSLVSQNGYLWEETTNIDECFEYYALHLFVGYTYSFRFTTQVAGLTSIPATVVDATGLQWNIPFFYGTFNVNQTYEIAASQDQVVYFKFGDIGYGNTIQVVLTQGLTGEEPFPLVLVLAIIAAASVVVNVLMIFLLRKARMGTLPSAQKRPIPAITPEHAANLPTNLNPPKPTLPPNP